MMDSIDDDRTNPESRRGDSDHRDDVVDVSAQVPGLLTVKFVGRSHVATTADENGLVFGRGATIDIDSNPFMHRQVGRFVVSGGLWWIENLSKWSPLSVTAGGITTILDGSGRVALSALDTTVSFQAGPCSYELHAKLDSLPELSPLSPPVEDLTLTQRPHYFVLTDEERLLAVALAEPRLLSPASPTAMPTNNQVAERLGWRISKFNRKLDYLCRKLDRAGVRGLHTPGKRTRDRRQHLVVHLVDTGVLTAADLQLLEAYPDPLVGAQQ